MNILRRIVPLALLLVFLLPASSSAHSSIYTYKYIDGDNLIMITHNIDDVQAGAAITYNLRLYTVEGQLIPFEQARAEVKRGRKVIDKESVSASEFGDANFLYTYPKQGNYVVTFTFADHDKQIARGEFPIVVDAGVDAGIFADAFTVMTAVAFILGAAAMALYSSRRKFITARIKKLRASIVK